MLEVPLLSIGLGLLIGAITAMTGAGGSILATPLLMLGFEIPLTQAAPIALLATMSASSIGAMQGLKAGVVRYKSALLIAGFGMLITPVGVWLAKQIPIFTLNLFFSAVLIFVAYRMWRMTTEIDAINHQKPEPVCMINPATSKVFWTASCTRRLILTGFGTGFLSGLLGIGGGFVVVPSLKKVSNFNMQTITATSLAVIAIITATSVGVYLWHGDINWTIALPFVLSSMLSMLALRVFSQKIPSIISQRLFAILALSAASMMLLKAFK
jgi:uncharacterized membrane protein YfcA